MPLAFVIRQLPSARRHPYHTADEQHHTPPLATERPNAPLTFHMLLNRFLPPQNLGAVASVGGSSQLYQVILQNDCKNLPGVLSKIGVGEASLPAQSAVGRIIRPAERSREATLAHQDLLQTFCNAT